MIVSCLALSVCLSSIKFRFSENFREVCILAYKHHLPGSVQMRICEVYYVSDLYKGNMYDDYNSCILFY